MMGQKDEHAGKYAMVNPTGNREIRVPLSLLIKYMYSQLSLMCTDFEKKMSKKMNSEFIYSWIGQIQ